MFRRKNRRQRKTRKPRRKTQRGGKITATAMQRPRDQFARIVETIPSTDTITPNVQYAEVFNLSEYPRARTLAVGFKWYRAKKVIYTYEPLFNTFQEGAGGTGINKPYMYLIMNRTQDSQVNTLQQLQQTGAMPQSFTSKKVFTYKPNWCTSGLSALQTGGGTLQLGLKEDYGWLPCPNALPVTGTAAPNQMTPLAPVNEFAGNMNVVTTGGTVYNGHIFYIDQSSTGDQLPVAKATVTVEWEFKGAHAIRGTT